MTPQTRERPPAEALAPGVVDAGDPYAGATFSVDGRYRYRLWRRWARRGPSVAWILLNPSTAASDRDDATTRRLRAYARAWGYAGYEVANLCAWRATDPADLRSAADPVGPHAEAFLLDVVTRASLLVCGWGAAPRRLESYGRVAAVRRLLDATGVRPYCLAATRRGDPCHPLRLPSRLEPRPWDPATGDGDGIQEARCDD